MSGFVSRTVRPEAGNKYYITKSSGGYSPCIQGKNSQGVPDPGCNVLPNCVGYAIGRFNEIGQWGYCKYFVSDNAERFILHRDNLEMGQDPRIGACMVWQKGATLDGGDGAGHVAIVERVVNGSCVVTSESGYGCANPFWTQTRNKGTGNWGMGSAYKFLGFIYNPAPCCGGGSTAQEAGNPVDYKAKTTAALNVRKGPGLNYSIVAGLRPGQEVRIIRESGKWGQLENGNWCCLDYLMKSGQENVKAEASGDWEPKVGDIVRFLGGKHYVNAYAAAGTAARAGKARITTIFQPEKSKHPYHLVYVAGGGSNVYGWVDKGSFEMV